MQATEALCHLSITDIKKTFCNVWFFCKNEACVNCGTLNATTLIWLLWVKMVRVWYIKPITWSCNLSVPLMTIKNLPLAIKILLLVSHLSWSPRQNILILKRIDPTLFCLIVMHKICIWLEQDCATFKPVSLFRSLVMVKLVRIRDLDARLKRNEKILWIYAIHTEKRLKIKMI